MNWFFLVKEILFGFAVIVDILLLEKKAPEVCPVCAHAKSFFERKAENY